MDNQDLFRPTFSFNRAATVSSPKGTLTFSAAGIGIILAFGFTELRTGFSH